MRSLKDTLEDMEREAILMALDECDWVMAKAARQLGITERMIGYKMKKYNIQKDTKNQALSNRDYKKNKMNKKGDGTMKTLKLLLLATILACSFCLGDVYADETQISGFASVDLMSNYVWRGQKLSNSWVIQPSVGITYGGFGTNLWANYDTDLNEHTETDLTLDYNFSVDKFSFDAGYIYYALDGTDDTQELYLSVGYDLLLSPTLTIYYDFDEGNGAFIVASIGHSFDLGKNIPLEVGASASYNINNKVMGFDEDGDDFSNFYNAELSSSVSISITKALSVTPKIAYSFPLSNDAKEAISSISDDGDKDIFYGGINLTLSF